MPLSFYVLNRGGILLYSQQVLSQDHLEQQLNPLLIAGFLSAIEQFAKEFVKQKLDIIEMGDYKLLFAYESDLEFVFSLVYQKEGDDQKYKYLLNVLKALFLQQFKIQFNKKSHNVSIYKKFDPYLELILNAFGINNVIIRVEHFFCGYLGDLRDFQSKNELICPYCQKTLQDKGIDYRVVQ
jgi:hypothetical protein